MSLVTWITVRELIHERVLYLLLSFAVGLIYLAILVGQMTYAEQAKLTMDFTLAAMECSMILFSIFMGIHLLHREIVLGTVAMILSKPIRRTEFLLGKYLGQCLVQWGVVTLMGLMAALLSLRFKSTIYFFPTLQTAFMIGLETMILTSIVFFFAVNAGILLTAIGSVCIFVLGHLQEAFPSRGSSGALMKIVKGLVPNLDLFNTKSLASYGVMCDEKVVFWAVTYTFICVIFFLIGAILIFNRKDILT